MSLNQKSVSLCNRNCNVAFATTAISFVNSTIRPSALLVLAFGLVLGNGRAETVWTSEFSDSHGWNQPQYGTTMMYGDLNGDGYIDVCGRGAAGIYCALSTGNKIPGNDPTGFIGANINEAKLATTDFSDQEGWLFNGYYTSIRLGDVNGDGRADVCGRRTSGVWCGLGKGDGTFDRAQLWTADFADPGWNFLFYGGTAMLGDLNGDGRDDFCARGAAGIYCALSTGTSFAPAYLANTDFTDATGWTNPSYYSSLRLADVNGDGYADVCGRGIWGILCGLGKGEGHFQVAQLWSSDFNNVADWDKIQYASTIMFGIACAISTGSSFRPIALLTSDFSNSEGWSASSTYYGSLRLADINGDHQADICGRGGDGLECDVAITKFQ